MPARDVGRLVGDLNELPPVEPINLTALAAYHADEGAAGPARQTGERREVELGRELHVVGDRVGQRERAPEAVERRREHGDTADALALEPVVEPGADAFDVALQ